ncbi:MAG: DUF3822 family protein [Bacteroidales bacterium]|nr:DUF3822 family protein [Bacteroidales bacterium]
MNEVSLLTPKCTLVPAHFFNPASPGQSLGEVALLDDADSVKWAEVPAYDAVLVYACPSQESTALPELWYVLRDLPGIREYNRILASWKEGRLFLGIAQGGTLLLANTYEAPDFTTAEYYVFLAMRSLQLNPEVSTIYFRHPIGAEEEMSLYRYFKGVEIL